MRIFIYVLLILALPLSFILPQEEVDEVSGPPVYVNGVLACGVERWYVKTCIDADTVNVNFNNIVPSSVSYQRSLVHPTLPSDNTTRLSVEDTVYSITCQLVEYKLESDQDYHVVIKTIGSASETMVAEIADPTCAGISNTSRYQKMTALRTWFTNRYNPTTSFKFASDTVVLTGVGFFDFSHGQTGAAPNQREIHPILSMSLYSSVVTLTLKALIEAMYVQGGTAMPMSPSITVELHNASSYALIESKTGTLNTTGIGNFNFTNAVNGTPYYIVIKSANTIETWSTAAQSFSSNVLNYDFTTGVAKAYTDGSNPPLALHGGKYCIYSGDVNQDGYITGDDYSGVDNDAASFVYHLVNDINGDGFVTGDDFTFIDNNASLFIQKQVPH